MPVDKRVVSPADAGASGVIGTVSTMQVLPAPYEQEVNRVLNRERAKLFELVELSLTDPEQLRTAKRQIREITSDAINDVRRLIQGIIKTPAG